MIFCWSTVFPQSLNRQLPVIFPLPMLLSCTARSELPSAHAPTIVARFRLGTCRKSYCLAFRWLVQGDQDRAHVADDQLCMPSSN